MVAGVKRNEANILPGLMPLAVPVSWLTKLPGNPNKGDVKRMARMLDRMGQHRPAVVWRTGEQDGHPVGTILGGNTMFEAATTILKWDQIAVVWTDDNDTEAKARAVGDNRAHELARTDTDLLIDMVSYVADDAELLAAAGYTEDELQALIDGPVPGDQDHNPKAQLDAMTYTILVTCDNEDHQAELLERFVDEGLTVKALMT